MSQQDIKDQNGSGERDARSTPSIIRTDEAIKILFRSEKRALIRLINSVLGESYDLEATEFVELNTEFVNRKQGYEEDEAEAETEAFDFDKIIADMMFTLNGVAYHIEFQTKADRTIAIRIIGYGTGYAMDRLRSMGSSDEVIFEIPVPVLIQIDKDDSLGDSIPAKLGISGRSDKLEFEIKVIKLWEHDVDSLVEMEHYLLLPFVLARHRNKKKTKRNTDAFIKDLRKVNEAVNELYDEGKINKNLATEMFAVIEGFALVINSRNYGGNAVIEEEMTNMKTTRSLFSHEIRAEGKAEGKAEGITENQMNIALIAFQGLKRGREMSDVVEMLKEFGIPDEIIESAKKQILDEMES